MALNAALFALLLEHAIATGPAATWITLLGPWASASPSRRSTAGAEASPARHSEAADRYRRGTGHVWAFLRDARDQALIQPGAIVVAGDEDAPAVAEVVDIGDRPARSVHLRVLPGLIEDYQAVIRRAVIPA